MRDALIHWLEAREVAFPASAFAACMQGFLALPYESGVLVQHGMVSASTCLATI